MKLYHGTKLVSLECKRILSEFPIASKAVNGVGFYLTNNIEVARQYGNIIEYEVPATWSAGIVRPIEVNGVEGMEYVLSQHEADELVVDHALEITIH